MISWQQYLENITLQEQIYPVLGEIISEYTGGQCDVNTQEGRLCWTYNNEDDNKESKNENCNIYCFNSPLHLNNWLLPIVEEVDKNHTNLDIIYLQDNQQEIINVPGNIFIEKSLVISGKSI